MNKDDAVVGLRGLRAWQHAAGIQEEVAQGLEIVREIERWQAAFS